MQIILEITQDANGRLTGTAIASDGGRERTFYGTMELLNSIEEFCSPATPGPGVAELRRSAMQDRGDRHRDHQHAAVEDGFDPDL
jgi:hypothetical protein